MKKIIVALLLVFPLLFTACKNDENATTEPETHPPVEITTAPVIPMEEMSPSHYNPELSMDIATKVSQIDFDSFEEIDAKDSVFPDSTHDKILQSDNAQYFFVEDDIKIHAVFFDENKRITASASYNTETGNIEFFGDSSVTWYFGEKGELLYFVYTYDFNSRSSAPIYTFYTPEGNKEVTRTMDGWYTPTLDLLTNEEIMEYLEKYAASIEATAEYKSSDITNQ